jgi:hypothetical protein
VEEIEEIKLKLKREIGKWLKRCHSYKIKVNKHIKKLKGELIQHKANFTKTSYDFVSQFPIIPKSNEVKTKNTSIVTN